ncbi:MAG: hypothetical protein NZ903_00635 [Candidatus Micrarchaeota archaeon]|nr:hypothetical protein [Candidatus Micrarchaeota archaeon]
MGNNKEVIVNKEAYFLDINPKDMNKSIISNIKKQLIFFPVSLGSMEVFLSYKIVYDFLTSNPNKKVVWMSVDKPVKKIIKEFQENGFDISQHKERIIFLDAISRSAAKSKNMKEFEVIYLENADNLVEISMSLDDVLSDESVELAIIDSINGLLAFNDERNVLKFIRFLSVIAEETDTSIINIFYKDGYSHLEHTLQIPCDGILEMEEDRIILRKKVETIIL